MRTTPFRSPFRSLLVLAALGASLAAQAGVGTYTFGGTLAALESGAPSLVAVDPLGGNNFGTASLYGATRPVYNTVGNPAFGENAGLTLAASSLVTATQYSLEMVVSVAAAPGYRKLADVSGRTADTGYYVLNERLNVFNDVTGTTPVVAGTYNYLVLTVSGNTVKGYVNGVPDFTATSSVMNGNGFAFFLDDAAVLSEWSSVSVGLLRLRDTVLTDAEVRTLALNPYAPVPEPTTVAALGLGALALVRRRVRRA